MAAHRPRSSEVAWSGAICEKRSVRAGLLLLLAACGGTTVATSTADANQACVDTIAAFAKAFQDKCGADINQETSTLTSEIAAGNCSNILSVRDENALRNTCFATLANISCADLQAGNVDPSCQKQLIRNQ
jgi:hypothetical protein